MNIRVWIFTSLTAMLTLSCAHSKDKSEHLSIGVNICQELGKSDLPCEINQRFFKFNENEDIRSLAFPQNKDIFVVITLGPVDGSEIMIELKNSKDKIAYKSSWIEVQSKIIHKIPKEALTTGDYSLKVIRNEGRLVGNTGSALSIGPAADIAKVNICKTIEPEQDHCTKSEIELDSQIKEIYVSVYFQELAPELEMRLSLDQIWSDLAVDFKHKAKRTILGQSKFFHADKLILTQKIEIDSHLCVPRKDGKHEKFLLHAQYAIGRDKFEQMVGVVICKGK